ncbi:NAD-dependent epimerase/dehydratase family protein [Cloacibacillus evryensis]
MKKILITGANSYVGASFEKWLSQWPNEYHVDTIDMIDGTWREKSFAGYDVVFHVAGIAHIKETKENAHQYYEINRDLAFETAQKAKADGVSQFIFMSSMSVYGIESGVITKNTKPSPKSHYGKSKLEAEEKISLLIDNIFALAVLRPPMIYGKGCKGNYQRLSEFAKKAPIFPDIHNERSMIYIDNLSEFIRNLIDEQTRGLFLPQNKEYVCTSELVKEIAKNHGKNIKKVYILNPLIRFFQPRIKTLNKVFGDFVYLQDNSLCQTIGFKESVKVSEQ